jgi:DNA-binding transcriptional LysR family regulator
MPASLNVPGISLQQLTYLDAVSAAETWGDAAASLMVSPSALSQGLAELEKRLGIELFDWQGRRRVLRPEAGEVLRYAQQVLAQTNDLTQWITRLKTGAVGSLRIGMIDAAAVHHFPDALRQFRRDHTDIAIHLVVAPSGALLDQLGHGDLDIAVCVPPTSGDWRIAALVEEDLAVYAPDRASAKRPAHTWGPWVTFPEGAHTRDVVSDAVRRLGARFDVVAESHQPEVLREMVQLGIGWTVLPVSQAEPSPMVRAVKAPVATRTIAAVQRGRGPDNPAVATLLVALSAAQTPRPRGKTQRTA